MAKTGRQDTRDADSTVFCFMAIDLNFGSFGELR
jgi:hypothetical protein